MSASNLSRRRGAILDEIMRYKRRELPRVIRDAPLADVQALAAVAPPALDFYGAIKQPGVSLIAECKRASPSKGLLVPDYHPVTLASAYERAGASALSVLTDRRFFQGALTHLRDVKESVRLPALRKDFIFHPYQLYESRASGADVVLLIAAVLSGGLLNELHDLAHTLGMQALVEVHTEDEMMRALKAGARIVGINNRNLQTFEVDFENSTRLRRLAPPEIAVVAESGISTEDDVRRLATLTFDAMLIGESLVRSPEPETMARRFAQAGRQSVPG